MAEGAMKVRVQLQPPAEEVAADEGEALEAPIEPVEPELEEGQPTEEELEGAGPQNLEEEEPQAPAAPAKKPVKPAPAPAKKPAPLPKEVAAKVQWHDHMLELGKKHKDIQIAYARACVAEGIAINDGLRALLKEADGKSTPAAAAVADSDLPQKVKDEYAKKMRAGDVIGAQRYLIQMEANARIAELEKKLADQEARVSQNAKSQQDRDADAAFEQNMMALQPVAKRFIDVVKQNGREVARFKDTAEARAVNAKMIELVENGVVAENAPLEDIYTMALVKLGLYGQEEEEAPPPPKMRPGAPRQQPRAPQNGQQRPNAAPQTPRRDGFLRWKVAVKG